MTTIRLKPNFKKNSYEKIAWQTGNVVCGVDEVGRGCLAGPVVTAAVILKTQSVPRTIKDSKAMSPQQRKEAYEWIRQNSWFATSIVHHRIIDNVNIYQATLKSMKRSVTQLFSILEKLPSTILVDAMPLEITTFNGPIYAFPFGETKSVSIAAASIIAKVTRDRLMESLDTIFPGYLLAQHKGYCTAMHREKLNQLERSIIHRKTFIQNLHTLDENQLNLFEIENNDESTEPIW